MNTLPTANRRKFLRQTATIGAAFTIIPRHVLGRGFVAPSDKLTVGFIGTGKQGRGLARRFADMAEMQIVGACEVEQQKLKWFQEIVAEKYAASRGTDTFEGLFTTSMHEELIQRADIDGIVVSTPDHWHAEPAIDAMKAGKHVYCEKPMAHTVKEGRAMVEAARKYSRIFQTGSMQRSRDTFLKACELVRNGYIGEVKQVLVNVGDPAKVCDLPVEETPAHIDWDRWLGPAPSRGFSSILSPPVEQDIFPKWRDYKEYGGGILSDWGAHMFDIAQWGLGMDNSGPVSYIPPADSQATRGLKMVYENGIEMYHQDFERGWGVRFIGTEGTLDISRQYLDSKPESIVTAEIKQGETRLYKSENHSLDWVQAIRNNTLPICDVEIGHRSASICNIANIAYELGRELTFDPVKEKFKGDGEANKMRGKEYRKGYRV
ncbi:MAG: Gfo/Idh/MocA family oxidoreductase [Bacteroidota bacterium]